MVELLVIKNFIGKEEGERVLAPTEKIVTNDIERINTLVSRGFCVITALDVPEQADADGKDENSDEPAASDKDGKKGKN